MTNIGKALIVGLVLIDLGFVSYLMLPKDDEKSKKEPDAEVTQSSVNAGVDPRFDDTHVTAGSVIHAPPATSATGKAANAGNTVQVPAVPAPAPQAPAPQAPVAQAPAPQAPPPPKQPQIQPAPATRSATVVHETVAAKPIPAPQSARARDDLSRHGSNSVAAAMTQQLVKESSKPDPSLPLPPPVQNAPASQDHHGSNPVGAAMTQELVRQSATVSPASQPAPRSGMQ